MLVLLAGAMLLFQASYMLDEVEQPQGAVNVIVPTPSGVQYERVVVEPLSNSKYRNLARQQYDYSCGSAALTTLLSFYVQQPVTEMQVMNGMLQYGDREQIVARRGFSLLDMKRYAGALGYGSGGFSAAVEDLADLDHPAIVPIHWGGFDHFVVLRGVAGGRVFLADPAMGNISMTVPRFNEVWEPQVLFMVYPNDEEPLNRLALSDEDLRIIDYDTLRRTALIQNPGLQIPLDRAADIASGQYLHYRP